MKNIKMVGIKKIDWHLLVREILEGLFISQQDLAERCGVCQQCISHWRTRRSTPNAYARQKLYELAEKEGIDLSKYETNSAREAINKYLENNNGKELKRLFELYIRMSRRAQVKLLRYGNSLVR